jgi:hypothetical protein
MNGRSKPSLPHRRSLLIGGLAGVAALVLAFARRHSVCELTCRVFGGSGALKSSRCFHRRGVDRGLCAGRARIGVTGFTRGMPRCAGGSDDSRPSASRQRASGWIDWCRADGNPIPARYPSELGDRVSSFLLICRPLPTGLIAARQGLVASQG